MKLVVTGYFNKQNYGDDLFKEIATTIFKPNIKYNKQCIQTTIIPIYELITNKDILDCDNLILFGGETLNNYFLDILIEFKKINVNPFFKMSAIGVSCNQEYNTLLNKLQIFEYISFRCMKDYEFFKTYIDSSFCPDMVMLLKPYNNSYKSHFPVTCNRPTTVNTKTVGFFLSQTAIANKPDDYKKEYIQKILIFINYLLQKGYNISLFSMCINDLKSESDIIINTQIYDAISDKGKKRTKLYTSLDDILKNMSNINYAICWRYHAHILSIINNIPFLSLSTTPKVTALLTEHKLEQISVETEPYKLIEYFTYLVNKKTELKAKIKQIYLTCHAQAETYKDLRLYFKERSKPTFYIEDMVIFNKLNMAFQARSFATAEEKTRFIIFFLMRSINNDYFYGLNEKIVERNIADLALLKDDILWLINDCILKKNQMFYLAIGANVIGANAYEIGLIGANAYEIGANAYEIGANAYEIGTIIDKPLIKYNFHYIDQDNYKGLHRAGWSYVAEQLYKYNSSAAEAILCDLYLDRTFHWNCEEYAQLKVIPYTKAWIGFIHHTCDTDYSNYNTTTLFTNKYFLDSLPQCKGLIVLSAALKQAVEELLLEKHITHIKVFSLVHPTEFTVDLFDMKAFIANKERKIIQVGAWLRVLDAINQVDLRENPLALTKCVLKCKNMNVYCHEDSFDEQPSISRDKKSRKTCLNLDVTILENLNNSEYDKLLQNNIVFIQLVNASAVNTIIECIVRHTPIIVNRLPATIELLGKDYPLFYDKVDEVTSLLDMNIIQKGWTYLRKLNKKKFTIKKFIKDLSKL